MVTREAARKLGINLPYASKPSWPVYKALLGFVTSVRSEINNSESPDMIDLGPFFGFRDLMNIPTDGRRCQCRFRGASLSESGSLSMRVS